MAYENFMGNKDFHPSSFRNQRKMWEAQQKLEMEERRQEELRLQYIKEQEMYKSKELMGKANPLNFMYEPPPGMLKDKEKQEADNSKLKFDWQRQGKSAPREVYAKDMEIHDQPFGIEVRNVKCIKCGKWGHINTDRQCPLYGQAKSEDGSKVEGPILTDWDTIDDGLRFKQCVRERVVDVSDPLQQYVHSDEDEGVNAGEEKVVKEMLARFSPRQQKKILRKLAKMERAGGKDSRSAKVKKKKKKKTKVKHQSSSGSEDDSDNDRHRRRRKKQAGSSESDNSERGRERQSHRHGTRSSDQWTLRETKSEKRHLNRHHGSSHTRKRAKYDSDSSSSDTDVSNSDSSWRDNKRRRSDSSKHRSKDASGKNKSYHAKNHGSYERHSSHHHSSHHHSTRHHS